MSDVWWECHECGIRRDERPERNAKCQCGSRAHVHRRCPCGIVFRPQKIAQKHCSKSCGMRYTPGKRKGKTFSDERRAEVRDCLQCGVSFRGVKDTHRRKQMYCSHRCYVRSKPESPLEAKAKAIMTRLGIAYAEQHPVSRWTVDFWLPHHSTVIEIDGHWHTMPGTKGRDARRDRLMRRRGIRVVRLNADQIGEIGQHVIRRRWTKWARENGQDPGPGALEPVDHDSETT